MGRKSQFSDELWAELEEAYAAGGVRDCVDILKRRGIHMPKATIWSHMYSHDIKSSGDRHSASVAEEEKEISDAELAAIVMHDRQIASLTAERNLWKRKYSESIQKGTLEDEIARLMTDYRQSMPDPKLKDFNVESPKRVQTEETMVLLLTDLHIGETVSYDAMHGVNKYDIPTAVARMEHLISQIIDICFEKLRGYKFKELRIYALGDLVNGMFGAMHDELIITQASDLMETVYGTAFLLVQLIGILLQFFEQIHICAAPGNHGRMQKKPWAKEAHLNWDVVIPQIASTKFYGNKRVTWNVPDSFFFLDEVRHQKILGLHGHQVKGWAGIPWYGINRTIGNLTDMVDHKRAADIENAAKNGEIVDLSDLKNMFVNHVVMGHFHTEAVFDRINGEIIAGPCMKGADEYTLSAGFKPSPAGQTIFGLHENHGVTHRWRIDLQNQYEPQGTLKWWPGGTLAGAWSMLS